MITVKDIASTIEAFAPRELQENYDNSGLQVGNPDMIVSAALLCLDVTEDILAEAIERHCNLIISHHPLLFGGIKQITGRTATQRIVINALRSNIAIYAAHTNLDAAWEGVSYEIAHTLKLFNLRVLVPNPKVPDKGLGVVGDIAPVPKMEFLRKVKEAFSVKALRFSAQSPQLVIRKVAVCGGAGASFIRQALSAGADAYVTGDVKYHDFTTYGLDLLIADMGHYESELCAQRIFSRIIREAFPDLVVYFAEAERNPIQII